MNLGLTHKTPDGESDPCDRGELQHEIDIHQHSKSRDEGQTRCHVGQLLGVFWLLQDDKHQHDNEQDHQHDEEDSPPALLVDVVCPENDEGAEDEHQDKEQEHAGGDRVAGGCRGAVHFPWQSEVDPHRVVARANQLLQLDEVDILRLICLYP